LQEYLFNLVVEAAGKADKVVYPFYFTPALVHTMVYVRVNFRGQVIDIHGPVKIVSSPVEATVWFEALGGAGGGVIEEAQAAFDKGGGRQTDRD
jgi:hypothetical protein